MLLFILPARAKKVFYKAFLTRFTYNCVLRLWPFEGDGTKQGLDILDRRCIKNIPPNIK